MLGKDKIFEISEVSKNRIQNALLKYYKDPVRCKNCSSVVQVPVGVKPSEIRRRKFCSKSCSAKFNNLGRTRHHKGNTCKLCNKLIAAHKTFCSSNCRKNIYLKRKIERLKKAGSFVVSWRQRTKLRALDYKGGCCQLCGYEKSVRALQFHHLKQGEKDFNISRVSKAWKTIKKELDKCILLCSNCHAEVHEGIISLLVI